MTATTYLLMLWGDPAECTDLEAAYALHREFDQQCAANGHEILGGEELQPSSTSRLVRMGSAGPEVTDGPYAETVEQLGGYYVVRTADREGLLRLAAPLVTPGPVGGGVIELRPIVDHGAGQAVA